MSTTFFKKKNQGSQSRSQDLLFKSNFQTPKLLCEFQIYIGILLTWILIGTSYLTCFKLGRQNFQPIFVVREVNTNGLLVTYCLLYCIMHPATNPEKLGKTCVNLVFVRANENVHKCASKKRKSDNLPNTQLNILFCLFHNTCCFYHVPKCALSIYISKTHKVFHCVYPHSPLFNPMRHFSMSFSLPVIILSHPDQGTDSRVALQSE